MIWGVANGGVISTNSDGSEAIVLWFNSADVSWISATFIDAPNETCSNPGTQDIKSTTIKYVEKPEFTDSSPLFITCGNGSRQISVDPLINADYYLWTLPSGFSSNTTTTTTNNITVNYTTLASGEIKVKGRVEACNFNGPEKSLTITRTPPDPTLTLTDGGGQEMCSGETWTYEASLSNFPSGYQYEWYATNSLQINGGYYTESSPLITSSNEASVHDTGNAYGNASVNVRLVKSGCPSSNLKTRTMQVGPFSSNQFYINGPSSVCPNEYFYLTAQPEEGVNFTGVLDYEWDWPNGWSYYGGQGTFTIDMQAPYGNFYSGAFICRVENRCGWTNSPAYKIISKSYSCYGAYSVTLSPNPVSSVLQLDFETWQNKDDAIQSSGDSGWLVEVFNDKFIKVASKTIAGAKGEIFVGNLPKGIYVLHATNGNNFTQTKFIKE